MRQGTRRIRRPDRTVAGPGQRAARGHPQIRVRLHHQDGFITPDGGTAFVGRRRFNVTAFGPRQEQRNRRALADLAVQRHPSTRLAREPMHLGQPQTASLPDGLGGEKRLKHFLGQSRWNAAARVADVDPHIIPGRMRSSTRQRSPHRDIMTGDRNVSADRHRIPSIQNQVEDGRFQLPWINEAIPKPRLCMQLHPNRLTHGLCEQRKHRRDHPVNRDDFRSQHLLAGKRQQLRRQPAATLRCPLDHLRSAHALGVITRFSLNAKGGGVAQHHGQQIVEIVRDAAGETAQRLHLLRLRQQVRRRQRRRTKNRRPQPVPQATGAPPAG